MLFRTEGCDASVPRFEVIVHYVGVGVTKDMDKVTVYYDGNKLELLRGGAVMVNKMFNFFWNFYLRIIVFQLNGNQIAQGTTIGQMKLLQSEIISISFDFGLLLKWNGDNRYLQQNTSFYIECFIFYYLG